LKRTMILQDLIDDLVTGATLFGTGGGGSPALARDIIGELAGRGPLPEVLPLSSFSGSVFFISAFGVGGIQNAQRSAGSLIEAYNLLLSQLDDAPAAIVPVEIGPLSLARALELAQATGLPLLDADVVGGRSSPEVFLETITLFDLPRTPLAVCNAAGDKAILMKSTSPQHEETFLRDFARMSGGDVAVVGYMLSREEAGRALVQKTVSRSVHAGQLLRRGERREFERLFESTAIFRGTVSEITESHDKAFAEHWVSISGEVSQARLYIKNENLVLLIDDEPAVTCPDLIGLLDADGQPISNSDLRIDQKVEVCVLPAPQLWRSSRGRKLFSPRLFDFNFEARLLP